MDTIEKAKALLREHAQDYVMETADRLVREGTAVWVDDPEVFNVVGLVHADKQNRAYIVVYLEDNDFETSEDFDLAIDG